MAARKNVKNSLQVGPLHIPIDKATSTRLAGRDGSRVECTCDDERIESADLFVATSMITVMLYSKSGFTLPPDGKNDITVEGRNATKMNEKTIKCHGRADLSLPHVQEKIRQHVEEVLSRTRRCYCDSCVDENETNALRLNVAKANRINLKKADADTLIDALLSGDA
jgi:hypothetical protein